MDKEEFLAIFSKKHLRFRNRNDASLFLNIANTFGFKWSYERDAISFDPFKYTLENVIFVDDDNLLRYDAAFWYSSSGYEIFLFRSFNE